MPSFLINDEKIKVLEKAADVFNSFFLSPKISIYVKWWKKIHFLFLKDSFPCKLHGIKIFPTTEAEIKSIILSLNSKNSSGYDEIMSKILKACASLISWPLSHIYDHSLFTGVFPDRLKVSIVKSFFKEGNKSSMTDCRPISLLPLFQMYCRRFCTIGYIIMAFKEQQLRFRSWHTEQKTEMKSLQKYSQNGEQ
jgi:hypothetical protein